MVLVFKMFLSYCDERVSENANKRYMVECFSSVLCLVAQSCLTLCDPLDCSLPGFSVHEDSPGKNIGVGYHALLQGIFPTQGSNPDLPHCRQILYHLSHQGSPRILAWVAYSFSRGSSQSKYWTRVSCIAGGFLTIWVTREVPRILEWVAYPFSGGSSPPRNWTRVSCLAGRFFTS